jgi:hypothetical protein
MRSNTAGWATITSRHQSTSCSINDAPGYGPKPQHCYAYALKTSEFSVLSLKPKTLSIPENTTLTVNGPAKSGRDFDLLTLAMSSKGTVTFSGPTELHDSKTGNLLATITGGSLPGTLHLSATATGQMYGHKCVDDTKTMKGTEMSCPAAKATVGCAGDLHKSFPKIPAGTLVSTVCRVTCKSCFSEPTRGGTVTKKSARGKAVITPKGLFHFFANLEQSASCVSSSLPQVGAGIWMPTPAPGQTAYPDGATVTLSCLQGYAQVPAGVPVNSLCVRGAFTPASASCVKSAPVANNNLVNKGVSGCTRTKQCGLCEGDCDNDHDCKTGMTCFQRNGMQPIPGCASGGKMDRRGYDFCYFTSTGNNMGLTTHEVVNKGVSGCSNTKRCGLCQGDCDSDLECAPSLKCFQRNGLQPVPGCNMVKQGNRRGFDFCFFPGHGYNPHNGGGG